MTGGTTTGITGLEAATGAATGCEAFAGGASGGDPEADAVEPVPGAWLGAGDAEAPAFASEVAGLPSVAGCTADESGACALESATRFDADAASAVEATGGCAFAAERFRITTTPLATPADTAKAAISTAT
ncbi:MAG: hypothetical protein ACHQQ3_00120 [Gemmatimonadales bacterium]